MWGGVLRGQRWGQGRGQKGLGGTTPGDGRILLHHRSLDMTLVKVLTVRSRGIAPVGEGRGRGWAGGRAAARAGTRVCLEMGGGGGTLDPQAG